MTQPTREVVLNTHAGAPRRVVLVLLWMVAFLPSAFYYLGHPHIYTPSGERPGWPNWLTVATLILLGVGAAYVLLRANPEVTLGKKAVPLFLALALPVYAALDGILRSEGQAPFPFALILIALIVITLWVTGFEMADLRLLGIFAGIVAAIALLMALALPENAYSSTAEGNVFYAEKFFDLPLLAGPLTGTNRLGVYLTLSYPFVALVRGKFLRFAIRIVIVVAVLLSGSRTSSLILGLLVIAQIVVVPKRHPRGSIVIGKLLVLLSMVMSVGLPFWALSSQGGQRFSGRENTWQYSLDVSYGSPVFGRGQNWYSSQLELAQEINNSHNLWLHWLVLGGGVGLAVLTVTLIYAVRKSFRMLAGGNAAPSLFLMTFFGVGAAEAAYNAQPLDILFVSSALPIILIILAVSAEDSSTDGRRITGGLTTPNSG